MVEYVRSKGVAQIAKQQTPYRDGTTHVIFEPLDVIARLGALVAKPRVKLTRFLRCVRPQQRASCASDTGQADKGNKANASEATEGATPAERRGAMAGFCSCKTAYMPSMAVRCRQSDAGSQSREERVVIDQILTHLERKAASTAAPRLPPCRAPPQARLFD
jgi:hypothetical protein